MRAVCPAPALAWARNAAYATPYSSRLGTNTPIITASAPRTTDADLFLVLRVFAPDGSEVVFQGALDPHTPVGQGWLRASHRRLDPARSTAWRPNHTHDRVEPLAPGEPVDVQVEIWPTCIVVPAGHRIGLTVRGATTSGTARRATCPT